MPVYATYIKFLTLSHAAYNQVNTEPNSYTSFPIPIWTMTFFHACLHFKTRNNKYFRQISRKLKYLGNRLRRQCRFVQLYRLSLPVSGGTTHIVIYISLLSMYLSSVLGLNLSLASVLNFDFLGCNWPRTLGVIVYFCIIMEIHANHLKQVKEKHAFSLHSLYPIFYGVRFCLLFPTC